MSKKKSSKVSYDRESDVLAVYISGGVEEEYRELAPGIGVELDKDREIIGFEILDALKVLKPLLRTKSVPKLRQRAYV